MMLSLVVALTLTPYLGYMFLREKEGHNDKEPATLEESKIYKIYKAFINPMLEVRWKRWAFIVGNSSNTSFFSFFFLHEVGCSEDASF